MALQAAAPTDAVPVKRRTCPRQKCNHKHGEGMFCHMFIFEEPKDDDDDDETETESEEESEEEDEDDDESDDDEEAKAAKAAVKAAAKLAKQEEKEAKKKKTLLPEDALTTPEWASKCGIIRCNCPHGVPYNDKGFYPVPQERFVGQTMLNQLGLVPDEGNQVYKAQVPPPVEVLRFTLGWVNPRSIGRARAACKEWSAEGMGFPHYEDMFRFEEALKFRAHDKALVAMVTFRGLCFTSGDLSVRVWDMKKMMATAAEEKAAALEAAAYVDGETKEADTMTKKKKGEEPDGSQEAPMELSTPVANCFRDTVDIARILECDQYLYACSANGALRQWSLPFDPTKVAFRGQMWLHNRVINDAAHWTYGDESVLFTACDDRVCRVWDLTKNACLHVIKPHDRESGTLRSVAASDHLLFLGSSNGKIYVYPTMQVCRREDRHECFLPPGPVPFCPQAELRHGDLDQEGGQDHTYDGHAKPVVSALSVGGLHGRQDRLFSGGTDGEVWIWSIPGEGTQFHCLQRLRAAHSLAVTQIRCAWAHVITAGDDACVRAFSLCPGAGWGSAGKEALERVVKVSGRVRALHLAKDDVEDGCTFLHVGTSRGVLHVFRLGLFV